MDMKKLVSDLVELSRRAGRAILDIYETDDFAVEYKEDDSPLTRADRRSHEVIVKGLEDIAPDIPVMSEEGSSVPFDKRKDWTEFFLVDPLDGTKEFIKRNGEFTVNIALIKNGIPTVGVVHVPVRGETFYAAKGHGAWLAHDKGEPEKIHVRTDIDIPLIVCASRSHGSGALDEFLARLEVGERISAGSALKFCLVAEGRVHFYPRFGPTWEWDTGAGHAVVLEAGGRVVDTKGANELQYNKKILKHEGFIVAPEVLLKRLREKL
jgi:3'(2'), 5'-bisphosphate nucleotidase